MMTRTKKAPRPFFPRLLSPTEASYKIRDLIRSRGKGATLENVYDNLALLGYEGEDAEDVLDIGNILATVEVRVGRLVAVPVLGKISYL